MSLFVVEASCCGCGLKDSAKIIAVADLILCLVISTLGSILPFGLLPFFCTFAAYVTLITVLLVIGIWKRRRGLLIPWLLTNATNTLILFMNLACFSIIEYIFEIEILVYIVGTCMVVWKVYGLLIVGNLYADFNKYVPVGHQILTNADNLTEINIT